MLVVSHIEPAVPGAYGARTLQPEMEPGDDDAARREKLAALVPAEALPFLAVLLDIDLGADLPRPELLPTQLREVTLGHLFGIIERSPQQRPLILLIEDVHWADPTTCELIERIVAADLSGALTVVTSRTPAGLDGAVGFNHVRLEPVSHAEARTLARFVAGDGVAADVIDEIAARSDGIPLFVEQLASALKLTAGDGPRRSPFPAASPNCCRLASTQWARSKRIAQLAAIIGSRVRARAPRGARRRRCTTPAILAAARSAARAIISIASSRAGLIERLGPTADGCGSATHW